METRYAERAKYLLRYQTRKSPGQFIEDIRKNAPQFGFRLHEVVDMRKLYQGYDVMIPDGFEAYTVILCNPQRSYKSIEKNPERNAAIIEQKHVVIYKGKNNETLINYLLLPKDFLAEVFPDDEEFPENLNQSCKKRMEIIEASL